MKTLKKLTLVFLFLAQITFGFVIRIGVNGAYQSFFPYEGFVRTFYGIYPVDGVYLGDTIRFYNYTPTNFTNVGENFHTITSFKVPANASNFDLSFDSRDANLTVDLVPDDTGIYSFRCTYHTNTALSHTMSKGFYTIYRPTSICGNRLINGRTCSGTNINGTFSGIVQNCLCITTTSPPTTNTGCSNGLVENSTCTGVGTCLSCTGIVQSCMCITSTTGIKPKPKIEEDGGVLYPNPADEYVIVPLRQGLKYNIYIIDEHAKEIMYERVEYQKEAKFDISKLKSGNYIVQLKYCACSTPKEGCQTPTIKSIKFIKK